MKVIVKHLAQTRKGKKRHISGVVNVLTFRWKYEKLKQTRESWNAWDIFTGQDSRLLQCQAFASAKIASTRKKPRQTLLSTFFQKDNMNLKH